MTSQTPDMSKIALANKMHDYVRYREFLDALGPLYKYVQDYRQLNSHGLWALPSFYYMVLET